jgi:hypothetical protein
MNYSKEKLARSIFVTNWEIESDTAQGCWNEIKSKLIDIIDSIANMEDFTKENSIGTIAAPHYIKSKQKLKEETT